MSARDDRPRRPVVWLLAALILAAAVVPLVFFDAGGQALTVAQEHEYQEEREKDRMMRALHDRGLTAPPDGAKRALAEPPFPESKNTDGQAGSGGRAVAYRAGGREEPSATARELAPEALFWRTGYGSWEPSMGIAPDGTIFTSARNSNIDPGIARSRDGGKTWDRVNPEGHKASLDPFVWVDPKTGRIFSSDIDAAPGLCVPISHSDDQGDTWTTTRGCGVTDHQNMFGGPAPEGTPQPEGYENVFYYCAISGGTLSDTSTITECLKSLDGGLTFTKTGIQPAYGLREGPGGEGFCNGAAGHGTVGPDGTIYLPRGWCDNPYIAISRDQGATWKQVEVSKDLPLPSFSHEAGVAVDRDGNVYYTWVAAKDDRARLSISRDGGETWSEPKDVTPPGVEEVSAFAPHVDVGDPGKIAMVFMGTTDPEVDEATGWNAYMIESFNALDEDPTFYAAPANDPATNALWKGSCDDLRCGNIGDFLDVAVAPDGTAWTALVDSCPTADDTCITGLPLDTPRGEAAVGQLVGGPSLRGAAPGPGPGGTPGTPAPPPAPAAPASEPPSACAAGAGFASVGVRPRGRGARFAFGLRGSPGRVDVDVFQQSRGRRVVEERLVARFRNRPRSFRWDGRANRPGRRVVDGYYFARFRTRGDTRRVTLRREEGRFRVRRGFYRRAACDLVRSFKLQRPVFSRELGISYRLSAPARVTVVVRRAGKVVKRFAARRSPGSRTVRLRVRGARRGDYTVRLVAEGEGSRVVSTLVSRRL